MKQRRRSFQDPFHVAAPPGAEGWESMYPAYLLFGEELQERDEQKFWFFDQMHNPEPLYPFDLMMPESWLVSLNQYTTRVWNLPTALGIEHRIVNGYLYLSPNVIDDPAMIAEREPVFLERARYYFEHWDEIYATWKQKMEALIAEITELPVPDLPEYEPDELMLDDDRNTAFYDVLDAYGRTLRTADLMWQHHFELLLLGYGAYVTFSDFCKSSLPDIPEQHIAQMVAGIDVLLFKPDAELRRLAKLAVDTGVDGAFAEGRSPEEIDAELEQSDTGRRWLEELEQIKDPWFNMATGDGLYHYYRSWYDDPSIAYASVVGHVRALKAGEQVLRPSDELARERDRLAQGYGALLDEQTRKTFDELLGLSRMVFPYVEEHKFFCDYWFLTRWWNKVREFGALLAKHGFLDDAEDVFQLGRHEVSTALDELLLTWATGGIPLGPSHWPPIVARRKELLARLGDWTPPPALGATPESITDPMSIMLWGITTQRVQEWAHADAGEGRLTGAAASPGVVEGPARVVVGVEEIAAVRDGDVLVCPITSPAWAPIFSNVSAVVTDIGGVMSHAAIVCREYGLPAVVGTGRATAEISTGQTIRVDGTSGVVTILDA